MITLDYLPGRENIKLYQDDEMFRINTDTYVLGEFIEVYKNDVVLDIGTNTGALLLYASRFNPKKLIGLDINERALELAEKNMALNNIKNYELILADANSYLGDEVDVIICNPPYFKTDKNNVSQNKYLNLAKHEDNLKLDSMIKTISKNLKLNGTLFFLFQTSRLTEVIEKLKRNHLTIKKMKFVYDVNKNYSNVFMVKCVKCAKKGLVVEKGVLIER